MLKIKFLKNIFGWFGNYFEDHKNILYKLTDKTRFFSAGPSKRRHAPLRGLKLNVLTQNGFLYNRIDETSDRIFWKCALSASVTCPAVFTTNMMLRVIDGRKNKHSHDKSAYESLKRSFLQKR